MKKYIYHLILSIVFIILYRIGSFSKIPFGDSMGKVLDVEINKLTIETYSVTHFLYVNFTILISRIFYFVDAIEIVRWINILSAVLVINILFSTIQLIFKNKWISMIGALAFGLSFTFWKNTENIEVYTFCLIWSSLYLLFTIKYLTNKKLLHLILSGCILGFSLFSHIQGILLIPSYLYIIYLAFKQNRNNIIYVCIPFIFFSLLYIYPLTYNLPIKNVLSSTNSSWVDDSLKKELLDYLKDLVKAIGYIIYNFWGLSVFLLFVSFKNIFKNQTLLFLVIFGLPVFGFATIFAVSDNYVFFLNFNMSYLIILCFGISNFITKYSNYKNLITFFICITPIYYLISKAIIANSEEGIEFHAKKSYKGGLDYYLLPWMNNNKGLLETVIDKKEVTDEYYWMEETAETYIEIKSKEMTLDEIKQL